LNRFPQHQFFSIDKSLEANLSSNHPYQAYVEGNLISGNPLGTVIALYEGTLESVSSAKACLQSGDIWGRSKAISRAVKLLTELLVSLDHKGGGEISANLQRLYSYMQSKLLDAHAEKAIGPLEETEQLLNTMLEGWRGAAEKMALEGALVPVGAVETQCVEEAAPFYGSFDEGFAAESGVSALF
jgi:flagellar secretion chaperone FliS